MVGVVGRQVIAHGSLVGYSLAQAEEPVGHSDRQQVGRNALSRGANVVCSFGARVRLGYLQHNARRRL